ncbi:G2/mitotic-specific cyclin-B3-like isoform 1-T2 [Glossina fuscipes fuscipes]
MLPANNTCMARENVSMPSVCENLVNVIGQTVRNENLKILETNVKRKAENNDARNVEPKRSAFSKLANVNFNHNNKITIHPDDAVKQRGEPTKKGDKRNDVQQSGEQTQQECCVMQKYEKGKIVMETNSRKLENSDNNKNITSKEVENVAGTSQSIKQLIVASSVENVPPSKKVTENKLICQTMQNNDEDFDRTNWNDPLHVSQYAMDIFKYLKERETAFPIDDYMKRQVNLSKNMRAILVDWMVGAQETMAFNDGSLHLAVKIVDLFLCKVVINKDKLQLLGATALFIACKFDNRTIPLIGELVYVCGDNYKYDDFIRMEISILRAIDFDLGIPLAYEFLRRYSYCGRVAATTLTLARYILEISLTYYDTVTFSDSKMAAAALFIALRMFGVDQGWNITLKYYSGYKLTDFVEIITVINGILHRKPKSNLNNVREKYISETFYEVARVPFITTPDLFKDNLDYI